MTDPIRNRTIRNRTLTPAELDGFAAELDAVRARTAASLGQADADYIRGIVKAVRYTEIAGRALLFAGAFVPAILLPAWIIGTLLLALSKILENMELGHNVIHGQYDWMGDPHLNGKTYEWDIAGTSDNWRNTHNFQHHTYTNVRGMDDDIGYGLLRIFPEQRWKPFYLAAAADRGGVRPVVRVGRGHPEPQAGPLVRGQDQQGARCARCSARRAGRCCARC